MDSNIIFDLFWNFPNFHQMLDLRPLLYVINFKTKQENTKILFNKSYRTHLNIWEIQKFENVGKGGGALKMKMIDNYFGGPKQSSIAIVIKNEK